MRKYGLQAPLVGDVLYDPPEHDTVTTLLQIGQDKTCAGAPVHVSAFDSREQARRTDSAGGTISGRLWMCGGGIKGLATAWVSSCLRPC